jgi:hypothetical protein
MELKTLLWIGAALATVPFASGCVGQDCGAAGCFDRVHVILEPEVGATYDVDLALDGVVGGFTCTESEGRWSLTNPTGSVNPTGSMPALGCWADGFYFEETPESVQISVDAQDGSWTGSVNESPNYHVFFPNGPECGGGCETAKLTVLKG